MKFRVEVDARFDAKNIEDAMLELGLYFLRSWALTAGASEIEPGLLEPESKVQVMAIDQ